MIPKSCEEVENTLENFVFNIVNQKFVMKPKSYLHASKSGKQCYLGFSSSPDEENQFVLGNYFLHQFYTVLDYERNVIMLGRKQNGLDDSDMVTIRSYDLPAAPVAVPEYVPAVVSEKEEPEPKHQEAPEPALETNEHSSLQAEMDKIAKRRIQAQQIDAEAEADYQTDDSAPAPVGQKKG